MKSTGIVLLCLTGVLFLSCPETPEDEVNPYRQEQIPWPSLADSPWPMFRHDPQGTGRSRYLGPQAGQVAGEWEDNVWFESSPVIGPDGIIYFTASASWDSCFLYAITSDGSILWKTYLEGEGVNLSKPTLSSYGLIYVSSDESIFAIDYNGNVIWAYLITSDVAPSISLDRDGNLYVLRLMREPLRLLSLTPTGSLRWDLEIPGETHAYYDPLLFSPDGSIIYVPGQDSLYAVSSEGNIRWGYWTGGTWLYPIIDNDGNIYIWDISLPVNKIVSISPEGETNWIYPIDAGEIRMINIAIAPTLDINGNLYYACDMEGGGGGILSLSVSGEYRWLRAVNYLSTDLVSDAEGFVYFGGLLHFSKLASAGDIVWEISLPNQARSPLNTPAISTASKCYMGSNFSNLLSLVIIE